MHVLVQYPTSKLTVKRAEQYDEYSKVPEIYGLYLQRK